MTNSVTVVEYAPLTEYTDISSLCYLTILAIYEYLPDMGKYDGYLDGVELVSKGIAIALYPCVKRGNEDERSCLISVPIQRTARASSLWIW